MKVDFDDTQDSVLQAFCLREALDLFLAEQALELPPQPLRPKVNLHYRPDGTLDSLTVTLDDAAS